MFFKKFKTNWNSRSTVRWFVFSYPKTFGLLFTGLVVGYGMVVNNETNKLTSYWSGVRDTMYSEDKTTRRGSKLLVYDSSRKD